MQCLADYLDSLPRPRFSDRALKQNEVVVKDALSQITQLNGKYFEWKSNNRKDIGVIAQEVETVFPELVTTDNKTQFKQVNYAGLIGVLIEVVKELKTITWSELLKRHNYLVKQKKTSPMRKTILTTAFLMISSVAVAGSPLMSSHLTGEAYTECLIKPNFLRFSDRRLKQNETAIDDALRKVTLLNGKYFEWKYDNRKDIGVIAQEIETVFPELVTTDKKTQFKQVNYAGLIGVLIEAVKELKKDNDQLKHQLGLYY